MQWEQGTEQRCRRVQSSWEELSSVELREEGGAEGRA